MILSDSLLGVEIFDLMIRVDSKQNVGNISLNITKIKLLITVGPTAEVLIASVILLQIVKWWVLGLILWKIMRPSLEPMSPSQNHKSEIENAWAFM